MQLFGVYFSYKAKKALQLFGVYFSNMYEGKKPWQLFGKLFPITTQRDYKQYEAFIYR